MPWHRLAQIPSLFSCKFCQANGSSHNVSESSDSNGENFTGIFERAHGAAGGPGRWLCTARAACPRAPARTACGIAGGARSSCRRAHGLLRRCPRRPADSHGHPLPHDARPAAPCAPCLRATAGCGVTELPALPLSRPERLGVEDRQGTGLVRSASWAPCRSCGVSALLLPSGLLRHRWAESTLPQTGVA